MAGNTNIVGGNLYEATLEELDDQQQRAPASGSSVYDQTLEQLETGRRERMQTAAAQATEVAPDRAAEARKLSIGTGIPQTIVERNFDRMQRESKIRNTPFDKIIRETPALAEFIEKPDNLKVVQDDLEPLGALEWLLSAPQRSFARGMQQIEVARLRNLSMQRPLTRAETDLLESAKFHMTEGGELGAGDSWFRGAVTGAAAQLPILFGAVLQGAKRAIPAGVTTGTMGAAAGPMGGALTFGAGATAGMIAGGLEFAFQVESGLALDEFLDFKDEMGQRIDPNAAKAAAVVSGALNAGLEVVGLGVLAKSIPGVEKLTGAIGRSAVKQALRVPTVRAALVEAAKTYGQTLVAETAVETAQRAVTVMAGELTKIAAGLPTKSGGEIAGDLAHEALGALQAFSLLSLPGPALSVAGARAQAQRAQHNEQFFTALAEGVAQTKSIERMPEAVQEFLQEVTKDGPIGTLYMPVESWAEYWQSKGQNPSEMAAQVIGNADAFDQAIRTGEDLAIPTANYAVKLAGTEHNAFFATELRLAPGEMNAREAKVFHEEQLALAQKPAEEQAGTPTSGEMIRSAVMQQLEGAGVERGAAQSYADLYGSAFVNLAERAGVDPQQLFGQYGLKVERPALEGSEKTKKAPRPEVLTEFAGKQVEEAAAVRGTAADVPATPAAQRLEDVRNLPPLELSEDYEPFRDFLEAERHLDVTKMGPAELLDTAVQLATINPLPEGERLSTAEQTRILQETASRSQNRGEQKREVLKFLQEYLPRVRRAENERMAKAQAEIEAERAKQQAIVDKNAPQAENQEGEDVTAEQVESRRVDQAREPAGSRVPAIEPGTGRKAESRAQQHIERLFSTILEHAQRHDATIDPAALRAEFEFRFDYWLEMRNLYASEGHNPHDLLREIARLGGLFEPEDRGGMYEELKWLGKGNRFGALAGVPGVFAGKRVRSTKAGQKARGFGFDVMLQMLQQDPRWSFIENIDHLIDLIDEAARHGVEKISTSELPGTDELRDVGIHLDRAWWPESWRPQNMLEEVTDEQLEGAEGDTSFDVEEFGQGLFDDQIKEQFAQPKADTLETGETQPRLPGAGDVRDQEVATPEVADLPFSLTAPVAKPEKGNKAQRSLFQEPRPVTQADLDAFTARAKEAYPALAELDLRVLPNGGITLETIAVTRANTGIGTEVMQALTRFADQRGVRIELSPAEKGYQPIDGGPKTSSYGRLKEFYRRFGFVDNRGRHRDESTLAGMYREPTIMAGRELFQAAYHGSPHRFEQFSLQNIGTGEGAQSYGWGLYFASKRDIADYYRNNLTDNAERFYLVDGERISRDSIDPDNYPKDAALHDTATGRLNAENFDQFVANVRAGFDAEWANEYEAEARRLQGKTVTLERPGRTYKVEIPESEDLLDWDRPASQQSPFVQDALRSLGIEWNVFKPRTPAQFKRWTQSKNFDRLWREDVGIRESLKEALGYLEQNNVERLNEWQQQHQGMFRQGVQDPTGARILDILEMRYRGGWEQSERERMQQVSKALHTAGIPGLQYLDNASRGAGARDRWVLTNYGADGRAVNSFTFGSEAEATKFIESREYKRQAKQFGYARHNVEHVPAAKQTHNFVIWDDRLISITEFDQPLRREPALLIQHNLTAKNLEHVLKTGGIAVPSLAIAKADDALTNFGEITLLGPRRMAEPSRDTQVFGADVYSPRYPTVHFKISREGEKQLSERLKPYSDVTDVNYFDLDSLQKEGTRYLRESDGRTKAAFLDSKGLLDREAIERARDEWSKKGPRDRASQFQFVAQRMLEDVIREQGLEGEFEAWVNGLFQSLEPKEQIFKGFTDQGNRSYTPHTLENVVKILKKELRGGESEGNLYGVGQLRAQFTPRFRTLKQIQNARDLIVSDADFEKVKKEVEDELFEITAELKPYYEHDAERFGFVDTVMAVMGDAPKMGLTRALAEYGFEGVPADVQTSIGDYLRKLRELPTEYFEAKVTRAVGLGEFTAAIVPSNLKPELKQALERAGLRVETYEKGDGRSDDSRKAAISQLARELGDDVLFQEPPTGDRRGSIRFGADRQFTINLFERADLSTFLHETGHFYLEVFGDLVKQVSAIPAAQRTPQQQQLLADETALRVWLADEGHTGEGWSEQQHEQFARGFEAYLMDGKAPSAELRSAFARFRAWLIGIYRSLAGLHVNMTPEVRKVLDRMVATDDAIAAAEHDAGVAPMFTDARTAGMSEAEFSLYARDVAEASRIARETLERQALEEVQREQRREWKARRAEIRQTVEQEVQTMPAYQALAAMQNGTKPDGSQLVEDFASDPLKLSRDLIVKKYGAERLKTLPRPYIYRADGGMDPDFVAQMFGFNSGDEMLTAVAEAPPQKVFIERETQRRMIAEQGSILLDGTLHDKATAAIAGEHRERVIRAELRALWKLQRQAAPYLAVGEAAVQAEKREREYERRWFEAEARLRIAIAEGRKQVEIEALDTEVKQLKEQARRGAATINAAMPSIELLRETARARIAGTRVRDLNPSVFLQAAKRASAAAIDDAARQDFEGAIQAKQQELINMALFHEATKTKADLEKRINQAIELGTTPARKRLGLAGQEYLDQVDGILDRYEFAHVSQKALDRRMAMRAWIQALESEGIPVDLPDELIDETKRIHFRELTVEALVGVTDGLQQIVHLARLKNRLLKSQADRELQDTANDLATSIRNHYKGKKRGQSIETRLPSAQTGRMLEAFFAGHRKLSSLARELDGFEDGGPMWEAVIRPLNDAADREAELNVTATKKLAALIRDAYPGSERIRLYDMVRIDAIGQSLSKMGRIMIALNWGNDGNRQRVMSGYGWSESQVAAVLETLDGRDWVFIQGVWDFIDSYWSEIADKQKRVTGIAPEKVEPLPVLTKFGTMRGGYFPIKYDDRLSAQAAGHVDLETANLQQQAAYVRATTRRGHTEARKKKVSMPIRADFGVIFEHVQQVIHDLSHHEMLIDVGRILGHRDVQKAIYETHGDIVYRQFKEGLKDVAFGTVPAVGGFEKALNHLRAGATIAGLAWNVTTSALQPLGLTQSVVRIGAGPVARGITRWLRSPKTFVETPAWIEEKSTFMRTRAMTQQREINELRNKVGVNTGRFANWIEAILDTVSLSKFGRQDVVDSFFFLIQQMQRIADIPTWLGQYEKAMAAGESEDRAIALADQAVLDSQGGGQVKDLASFQRGGPLLRLWTNFYSFFNTTYNLAVESKRRNSPGRVASDYLMLFIVPATLGYFLRAALRPGDDIDDDGEWLVALARENVAYAMGMLLGLRELAGAAEGYAGYEGPAGARAFASAAKLVKQTEQGEADAAFWRALNDTAGTLLHYPAGQVRRTVEGAAALIEGKTANPLALITGAPRE